MSLDRSLAPRWIRHPSHSADDSCTWSAIVWGAAGGCCKREEGRKTHQTGRGRRWTLREDECKEDARGINYMCPRTHTRACVSVQRAGVGNSDAVRQQHRRPWLADRWDVVNQQSDLYTLTLLCRWFAEGRAKLVCMRVHLCTADLNNGCFPVWNSG